MHMPMCICVCIIVYVSVHKHDLVCSLDPPPICVMSPWGCIMLSDPRWRVGLHGIEAMVGGGAGKGLRTRGCYY